MATRTLLESTGDRLTDKILEGVIGIFDHAFPGRVVGFYLRGSLASGTRTDGSDIDLFVVFEDGFQEAEGGRAAEVARSCAKLSPILLEIIPVSEQRLRERDVFALALNLKLATRLIHGRDIRSGLPAMDVEDYVRSVVHTPYFSYRFPAQRRDGPALAYPLGHLDPAGDFYGYDQWLMPGPDGDDLPSTKLLVATVGWTATAIVALRTGRYVRDKAACVGLYRDHIADRWTGLVVDVHEYCRNRWHYRVPQDEESRARLRALCRRTADFQNHFLGLYREYLLAELRSGDPDRQALAAGRLGQVTFPDDEVTQTLRDLAGSSKDGGVREAASSTLERSAPPEEASP